MNSLPLRFPVVLGLLLFAAGISYSIEGAAIPSTKSLYDQALQNYSSGLYTEALALFVQVQALGGAYRETHAYIDRCAKTLSDQREDQALASTVEQARSFLILRESTLKTLTEKGAINTTLEDGSHSFQCSMDLFNDEPTWEAFNAFIVTVPGAWVTFLSERPPPVPHEALLLAERLVREGGFPTGRLSFRSRSGGGPGMTILVSPREPVFGKEDRLLPGVMVRSGMSELKLNEPGDLPFYLFALTLEKSRRWRLELVNERGSIVRVFEGPPTVLAQVRWDGRDEKTQSVEAGRYSARFLVLGWGEDVLTNTAPFTVSKKEEISKKLPVPIRADPVLPVRRQHRFVIRFQEEIAVPLERERDVATRVAYLLTINPEKKVRVAGGTGAGEKNPDALALQRAGWVRDELLRLGVPDFRIQVGVSLREDGPGVVVAFEE